MHYEVEVTIPRPLDEATARFLEAVCRSANRVRRFHGDRAGIHLTVEASGMCREDAVRCAVREVVEQVIASKSFLRNSIFGQRCD